MPVTGVVGRKGLEQGASPTVLGIGEGASTGNVWHHALISLKPRNDLRLDEHTEQMNEVNYSSLFDQMFVFHL